MNRKFDDLGRIVIPKEMRDKIGLKNGDEATIELVGDKIIISNINNNWEEKIDRAIEELEFLKIKGSKFINVDLLNKPISILKGEE